MRGGGRAGAAAVEAVAFGFVLVLLLGMLQQYGWGMAQKLVLEEAARHGAEAARRLAFSGQARPSFQALQAEAFRAMADFLRANGLKDVSPLSGSGALRAGLIAARQPGDAIARVHLTSKNLFLKLASGGEITAEVMTYVGTGASGLSSLSTCTQTASDCLGHVFTAQAGDCPQAEEQARRLAQQHELLHGCGGPGPSIFQCRQKASDRCGHEFEAMASSSLSMEEACRLARIQAEQLAQQHQAQDPPGCGQPQPPPPVDCYKCEGGNLIRQQFVGECRPGWSPNPVPCLKPVDCYKCEEGNLIQQKFFGSCEAGWSPNPLPCPTPPPKPCYLVEVWSSKVICRSNGDVFDHGDIYQTGYSTTCEPFVNPRRDRPCGLTVQERRCTPVNSSLCEGK